MLPTIAHQQPLFQWGVSGLCLEGPCAQVPGSGGESDLGTCVSGGAKALAGGGVFPIATQGP